MPDTPTRIHTTATVHPTAVIDPSATIGKGAVVHVGAVIGANVVVGAQSQIGSYVVIHADTHLGEGVRVDDHAVLGKQPMRAARSATTSAEALPGCVVGDTCTIGTHEVIYRGAVLGASVLVADLATVREHVSIGAQTIIGRGVAVENKTSIGARCKIETNAYITAYSTLEDDVFVAPGVLTSNDAYMGRSAKRYGSYRGVIAQKGARMGVGAVILPGRTLAEDAVVGAGALQTKDATAAHIHVGVPARVTRRVDDDQLLKHQ